MLKPNNIQPGTYLILILPADIVKETNEAKPNIELFPSVQHDAGLPKILIGKADSTTQEHKSGNTVLRISIKTSGVVYIDVDRQVRILKMLKDINLTYSTYNADVNNKYIFEYSLDNLSLAKIVLSQEMSKVIHEYSNKIYSTTVHDRLLANGIVENE